MSENQAAAVEPSPVGKVMARAADEAPVLPLVEVPSPDCQHQGHGYEEHREELLARLRRVEGQVRGIQRMLADDRYCIDILTQLAAVQAALNKVGLTILAGHTKSCVTAAVREGDEEAKIAELMAVIQRFIR